MRFSFERFMRKQWGRLGVWHTILIPLSWLFMLLSALRRLAYKTRIFKSVKLPVPVIVVGNISVGGTGKTPLVIWLAEHLQQQGYTPGIISRGYGGHAASITPVFKDSDAAFVGDEPVLIARRGLWPVWVGSDRCAAGQALVQAHPECNVIISDDGLQHYALARDVELAVVDTERGFGNGLRIPAGPLREGKGRLHCVDAVVSHGEKMGSTSFPMRLVGESFCSVANPEKTANEDDFINQDVVAVAGIGHPGRFFAKMRTMGLRFRELSFPDHHPFRLEDLQSLEADAILMTEKDAVKCAAFAQENWWYLPVTAEVDESLATLILNKLRNLNGP